jgi:hypothetical protein
LLRCAHCWLARTMLHMLPRAHVATVARPAMRPLPAQATSHGAPLTACAPPLCISHVLSRSAQRPAAPQPYPYPCARACAHQRTPHMCHQAVVSPRTTTRRPQGPAQMPRPRFRPPTRAPAPTGLQLMHMWGTRSYAWRLTHPKQDVCAPHSNPSSPIPPRSIRLLGQRLLLLLLPPSPAAACRAACRLASSVLHAPCVLPLAVRMHAHIHIHAWRTDAITAHTPRAAPECAAA